MIRAWIAKNKNKFRLTRSEQYYLYNYITKNADVWGRLDVALKNLDYRCGLEKELKRRLADNRPSKVEFCILYNLLKYIEALNNGEVLA